MCSPLRIRGKVFQRKTNRIHEPVATRTRLLNPVPGHLLPQCQRPSRPFGVGFFQRRHVRRRFGRRRSQNIFQNPDTPFDWRGAVVLHPCRRQKASVTQQSVTVVQFRPEIDTPKTGSVDVGDAVVSSQPLVQKCKVRRQHLQNVEVFAHNRFEEQFRLARESLPQLVVPIWKLSLRWRGSRQVSQIEPLLREVLDQTL